MAKTNLKVKQPKQYTHEGAVADRITPLKQLQRSVMSCLLWEREFYEDGTEIAVRLEHLVAQCAPSDVAALAIRARKEGNLRHVPLFLVAALAQKVRGTSMVSEAIYQVINRADELAEFLSIYARLNHVTPDKVKHVMSAQVKKGLAKAFHKFDEYQFAKYNRDNGIKLRDVLFLCHARAGNDEKTAALFKAIAEDTLKTPDTWEVALSAGKDKRETFARLIMEERLGYLALLRNLRKMSEIGVNEDVVKGAILARRGSERVLPFRYVAAAKHAPQFEAELDHAMGWSIDQLPAFDGKTIILVDISGSMNVPLSGKSDMTRVHAAAALASIINGDCKVFVFNNDVKQLPYRRGMAGVDQITSKVGGGTYLYEALQRVNGIKHDRLIVITDEQSSGIKRTTPNAERAYCINVASAQNGITYGKPWVHIDGFSENVIKFIHEFENNED